MTKKILGVLVCLSLLNACNNKANNQTLRLDASSITEDESLNDNNKSEKIIEMAEKLLSPTSYMLANDLVDLAIQLDPNNKKAQFYKALLGPLMSLKGSLSKAKYYINKEAKRSYKDPSNIKFHSYDALVKRFPENLRNLLVDDSQPATTEDAVQEVLLTYYQALDNLRMFLKNNKNLELELNINPSLFRAQTTDVRAQVKGSRNVIENAYIAETCRAKFISKGVYDLTNCEKEDFTQTNIKLNRADIEAAQHIVAGSQLFLTAYLAYNYSGLYEKVNSFKDKDLSNEHQLRLLLQNPKFGTLKNPDLLKKVKEFGLDYSSGLKYALKLHNKLCPDGDTKEQSRPNHLMSKGICLFAPDRINTYQWEGYNGEIQTESWAEHRGGITNSPKKSGAQKYIETLDLALAGQPLKVDFGGQYFYDYDSDTEGTTQTYETEIVPLAILEAPVQDIRSLGLKGNSCGDLIPYADPSINGLFPHKDADFALLMNNPMREHYGFNTYDVMLCKN